MREIREFGGIITKDDFKNYRFVHVFIGSKYVFQHFDMQFFLISNKITVHFGNNVSALKFC